MGFGRKTKKQENSPMSFCTCAGRRLINQFQGHMSIGWPCFQLRPHWRNSRAERRRGGGVPDLDLSCLSFLLSFLGLLRLFFPSSRRLANRNLQTVFREFLDKGLEKGWPESLCKEQSQITLFKSPLSPFRSSFWGVSRYVLFICLGLLEGPTRNIPERVWDAIRTFPQKNGNPPPPGLEDPRWLTSQETLGLHVIN